MNAAADFVRLTLAVLMASGFVRHENGGTVWFESSGAAAASAAETLVLVHGANDQAGTWFTVAPALARTYRVILPDLAGHGESAPDDGPIAISRIVSRLE